MEDLPRDVIFSIGLAMDLPEILTYCLLSKRHNDIVCNNDSFWSMKLYRDYGINIKGTSLKYAYEDFFNIKNKEYVTLDELVLDTSNESIGIFKTDDTLSITYKLRTNFGEILLDISKTEMCKYLSKYELIDNDGFIGYGAAANQSLEYETPFIFENVITLINDLTEMGYKYDH